MPRAATSRAGWTTVAFGDVARLSRERSTDPESDGFERFVGLEHIEPGALRIRRWGDMADGTTFTSVFRPGHVLFGKRRAYQRKVAVAEFSGVCSGDIYVLEPKNNGLLPELLPFICQTDAFFEHAVGTSAGSLSPRTSWTSLSSFEFALPPVAEQRRLVDVFLAVARVTEACMDVSSRAREARLSVESSAFKGVLCESPREGVSLGDVFEQIVDKGHTCLPTLSVTIDGEVVRRDQLERNVSDETGEEKLLRVLPGDLAYNTMRLWQGAIGVVRQEGLISPAYTVLRLRDAAVRPEFFLALLRSPVLQRRYRSLVTGVASDRWRLYYRDLCKVRVELPDRSHVERIMAALDALHSAEAQARRLGGRAHSFLGAVIQRELCE